LWSIFDFFSPGLLGSAKDFKAFVKELNEQARRESLWDAAALVAALHSPAAQTDPGVAPDLPEKTEMRVEMRPLQKQAVYYERAVARSG